MEDDERSGRPRNVVNEENAAFVREFIRKEPKSSLKYMESECLQKKTNFFVFFIKSCNF